METKAAHLTAVPSPTAAELPQAVEVAQFSATDSKPQDPNADPHASERALQDLMFEYLEERRQLATRLNLIDSTLLEQAMRLNEIRKVRGGICKVENIEGMLRYLPPYQRK